MAMYRFTMGFRQLGRTASETYYHEASDIKAAATLATKLMNARNKMLFTTTEWVGIRIGLALKTRQAQLYTPGGYTEALDGLNLNVPARGTLGYDKGKKSPDQPNSCIQIVVRFGDTRSTKRYLAFVPDEVVSGDPDSIDIGKNGDFADGYKAFKALLEDGSWKIRARMVEAPADEKDIQDWVLSDMAPNLMGAVLIKATAPALVTGDKVAIKGTRRKGTDKMSYNGIYRAKTVVDSESAGTRTVYLGHSDGGDPASIKVNGKFQKVLYDFYTIDKWSWFRAGTHKRGVSFGAAHGRRLTRVLLDP